jgi:hypothetical protein
VHNSPKENLAFKIQFEKTNLRWELDSSPPNKATIKRMKTNILTWEIELKNLENNSCKTP